MYLLTYLFICTRWYISQTIWHWLPIFQVDLHCALHRVATSSCHGHIDELVTEPFLLLHREHGTGYRRSWNCCDWRTCSVVIWKHFCFILSTGHRIRIDSVMRPQSSSRGRNTSASVTVTVTQRRKSRPMCTALWQLSSHVAGHHCSIHPTVACQLTLRVRQTRRLQCTFQYVTHLTATHNDECGTRKNLRCLMILWPVLLSPLVTYHGRVTVCLNFLLTW